MDQRLHRLVRRFVRLARRGLAGVRDRLVERRFRQAGRGGEDVSAQRGVEERGAADARLFAGARFGGGEERLHARGVRHLGAFGREEGKRLREVDAEPLRESLGDSGREAAVELRDGLPAVLVVLVGLDGDARERRVRADVVRLAQEAVAGGEPAVEKLEQVDLAARHRERVEVEVVDVYPPLAVRAGLLRTQQELLVVLLCRGRAVLQHRAHRGVAVDVRVVALEVALLRVARRDFVEDVHELRVLLARPRAVRAEEAERARDVLPAGFGERLLDRILHFVDARGAVVRNGGKGVAHADADAGGGGNVGTARVAHRALDGADDLRLVVRVAAAVALEDFGDHGWKVVLGCWKKSSPRGNRRRRISRRARTPHGRRRGETDPD